jgi:uncharacterized membrane protein YkoI
MSRAARVIVGIVAGILIGVVAQAGEKEKKIKQSDLPPAVQKTAAQESAGGTVTGYTQNTENGAIVYEMNLLVDGKPKEIVIGPDGIVLAVEQEVAWDQLPANVQSGLKQQAGAGKIGKVTSTTKQGKVTSYEANVTTNGKKSEVEVDAEGKALSH